MTTDPMPGNEFEASPIQRGSNAYYSVAELMAMDEGELQGLWDELPPDRQQFYENAYSSALASLGTSDVTDDQAMGIIEQILAHYEGGQVPIITGNRWVQVPMGVRERVERGENIEQIVAESVAEEKEADKGRAKVTKTTIVKDRTAGQKAKSSGPPPFVVIGALVFCFLCVGFLLLRGRSRDDNPSEEDMTATAIALAAANNTDATPTPFSITEADDIINEGEDVEDYYPVLLEIIPQSGSGKRSFIVQQKPIEVADWEYEARNEEVASWISGLIVRPVLGIPYSPENSEFLNGMLPGDIILLHMSTGTVLRFDMKDKARVLQQDRDVFRQVSPGVILVLLGEPNINDRLVIQGEYPPQQELLRDESSLNVGNSPSLIQTGQPATLAGSDATVTVLESYASLGEEIGLPETLAYVLVDLEITTGSQPLNTSELQFDLTDTGGRYAASTFDASLGNFPSLTGQIIPANTTQQTTIGFLVPRDVSTVATLGVRLGPSGTPVSYLLQYVSPSTLIAMPAEVSVLSVVTEAEADETKGEVIITVNVFNPSNADIRIQQKDFYIITSVNDPNGIFPSGPQIFPTLVNDVLTLDFRLPGGQAIELVARFPWDKSLWIGIHVLDYEFIAEMPEE